ncbi:Hypothetical predicted protein [Mytilus galloprovincialis]|uniref:Integrase catalytic domain-containing protein n=1 Tax=Mytilus galloprovincialis TaxID=29158 RepID=A0A8B6FAK6_MYTGA|nr:Hypothetical predicted protein [Mytilus galloprovincialis]
MFGKPVDVHFTSNGHYCINIKDRRTGQTDSVWSEERNPEGEKTHSWLLTNSCRYGLVYMVLPEVGVYTDNGGEFNSQIFRDMAENLNMSVKTTAGYSPSSNAIVERHNVTLTETVKKSEKAQIYLGKLQLAGL